MASTSVVFPWSTCAMMAILRICGMDPSFLFDCRFGAGCGLYLKPAGISDENRKGCKCELAAPTFDSERNYKCIRSVKSIMTGAFAPRTRRVGVQSAEVKNGSAFYTRW